MKGGDEEPKSMGTPADVTSESTAPATAILPDNAQDPLAHDDWDPFWKEVEQYFQPLRESDVSFLKNLEARDTTLDDHDPSLSIPPLNYLKRNGDWDTKSGSSDDGRDGSQSGKRPKKKKSSLQDDLEDTNGTKDEPSETQQRLNSYPFTHRLIAALIDEGGGKAMSIPNMKSKAGHTEEGAWIGPGEEGNLRSFQRALEARITAELLKFGLIDADDEDPLQADMRQSQWVLRDLKMANKNRRETLSAKVLKNGLKNQARAREIKRNNDQLEVAYLDHMIRKCKKNKRMRSYYQRVLKALFPQYKMPKKDVDDAKDEEPLPTPHKSVKKKSYNKRPPGGQNSTKAASKLKDSKSEDELLPGKEDDDPEAYLK